MATTWDELRWGDASRPRKITFDEAETIRARCRMPGVTQDAIARELGVVPSTISKIVHRQTHCRPAVEQPFQLNYSGSTWNQQANEFLNRAPGPSLSWWSWARARGYSESRITAEETRIAPPARHICEPGTACCAAVIGFDADRLAAD